MDANRFDQFTLSLADVLSRRAALSVAVGGAIGSLFGLADIEAKKRKNGKGKGKGKRKNKNKRKNTKPCTVSNDAVALVTESKFNKKPLRLRQRADFANGGMQTEVTLGGNAVVKVTHEVAEPGVVTTVTYGGAFRGIDQARFATDGVTITGEIDGRAIVPLPVGADPSQMAFADGGPPLDAQGDAKLVQAIEGLFSKAAQQATTCQPTEQTRTASAKDASQPAQRKRSASPKDHSSSFDCITKQVKCGIDMIECERGVIDAAAACSIVPVIGTAVCGLAGTLYCAHKAATCVREAKYSSTCCPVRCGGDVGDLFGPDPLCCHEACLDPNSNQSGGCCRAGETGCGGECCPTGKCTNGFCCAPPNGAVCGNQCCNPFDSCCGVQCCTGICNGNTCCTGSATPCGNGCCSNVCCAGTCCASGQSCVSGTCTKVCAPGLRPCPNDGSPSCCFPGQQCCPNGECCPSGTTCCTRFGVWQCSATSCLN
jgi:hypothetical protein